MEAGVVYDLAKSPQPLPVPGTEEVRKLVLCWQSLAFQICLSVLSSYLL